MSNKRKTRIKVEVTLANGRTTEVEHSVEPGYYDSALAAFHEIYGEQNVKEMR